MWQRFHNEPDDSFAANLVEDEPLVDVMALDDVLFDDSNKYVSQSTWLLIRQLLWLKWRQLLPKDV